MPSSGVSFGRAVILAVGSELLTSLRIDTNSLTITAALNATGIDVIWKAVVGDDHDSLARLLTRALEDADLVVLSGGLGPTDDDVTRDVVSAVLGLPLKEDGAIVDAIAARFAARGWPMPANNRRQANVPDGAVVLPNPRGTAPGLWIEQGGRALLLLPGPPRELAPLLEDALQAHVRPRTGGQRLVRRVVRMTGRGESLIDELLQPCYREWAARTVPVRATILAAMGQLELHLSATHADAARAESAVAAAADEACARVGRDAFTDRGESLEAVVGQLLVVHGRAGGRPVDGRPGRLAVLRPGRGDLQQCGQSPVAGCARGAHRRARGRQRPGRPCDGFGHSRTGGGRRGHQCHRYRRA